MKQRLAATLLSATALAMPGLAQAQSTDDNAVESAEDAFGTVTGHEAIGVYDEGNVRGFSPGSAGNFRMEGMYFDIQGGLGSRVIDGETIRVGPAAQGYAFPAPTGIVDLELKKAGEKLTVSPFVSVDSFGAYALELDAQVPLAGKHLSMSIGAGRYDNHYANGAESTGLTFGVVPRWRPSKNVELLAFYNHQQFDDEQPQQFYAPTGNFLPPRIARDNYTGPDWARTDSHSDTFGTVGHANLGKWTVRAGLFHSEFGQDTGYANLVLVNPDLGTDRNIYAYPGYHAASWSGELRVSRRFDDGPRRHLITAALRGRSIDARYGGGDDATVGHGGIDERIGSVRPAFAFGPQTQDHTRQVTGALGYSLAWKGIGELTAGVQRTRYRKTVDLPGGPRSFGESLVTLPTFSAAAPLTRELSLYGSYVRGLEDAGSAPGYAANANQVLPAIRTKQLDGGIRWSPVKDTTLILGYFWISKPYIALDTANHFGVLGAETHEGIELSLTSNVTSNLRIVAGGVWQDPHVSALPTVADPVGPRPVGQPRLRTRFNVNWTLPFAKGLSLDGYMNYEGGAYGTVDNSVYADGAARFGVGARYKFKVAGKPVTARVALYNIFDAYFVFPVASGVYAYNTRRNVQAYLTADF